jgi:hypothetical protein
MAEQGQIAADYVLGTDEWTLERFERWKAFQKEYQVIPADWAKLWIALRWLFERDPQITSFPVILAATQNLWGLLELLHREFARDGVELRSWRSAWFKRFLAMPPETLPWRVDAANNAKEERDLRRSHIDVLAVFPATSVLPLFSDDEVETLWLTKTWQQSVQGNFTEWRLAQAARYGHGLLVPGLEDLTPRAQMALSIQDAFYSSATYDRESFYRAMRRHPPEEARLAAFYVWPGAAIAFAP